MLLIRLIDLGVGQRPAGGLANVESEQVPRHEVEVTEVDDAAGGLLRADGHLDLKPADILLDGTGQPRVSDLKPANTPGRRHH
jgi:hypothetical protein